MENFLKVCSLVILWSYPLSAWTKVPGTAKIAFSSNRDGNWNIYLMNPDGSEQVKLTDHISDDYNPVFSATGEKIIFASNRGLAGRDLYIMNADGTRVQQIFAKPTNRQEPSAGPGGAMIAYQKKGPDNWGLYIASLKDKTEQWLAWTGGFGGMPDWSPNGTEIAFVMGVERFQGIEGVFGNTQIVFINLQTHIQKVFMAGNVPLMGTPAWGPSGDTIAFSWKKPGIGQESAIYISTREGGQAKRIVPPAGNPVIKQYSPVWSPPGNELIYVQSDGEGEQLFKIALDNGEPIQLTHRGDNRDPDWFDPKFALSVQTQLQLLTATWGELKQE